MLRQVYFMLYQMCISCPNLPSRDTFWNSGPAGQCFRVPPQAFPRIRVRGITCVTLKSCCLRCSASTCCPHLVSTVTGEDHRLGCGPVTHLVREGPTSGLAGLGRTGLGGSSLPVPIGPGPAILHARSHWAGPGTHRRGPQPWAHAADGSPVRLPQRTRSLCSLRDASASDRLASDCKRKPLGSQGSIPASPPRCVPRCPGCRRPAASRTCPDSE
jgi:hypothetical protein